MIKSVTLKKKVMKIQTAKLTILLIMGLFIHCETETINGSHKITGKLINSPSCKNDIKSTYNGIITPDSLSCVSYSYNELSKKLDINHINAGFNCCPKKIYCHINLMHDTIVIREFEAEALCDCDCLYDLHLEIYGLETGKYILKFIEPYRRHQKELISEIDLEKNKEGTFCAIRKEYPWGMMSKNG